MDPSSTLNPPTPEQPPLEVTSFEEVSTHLTTLAQTLSGLTTCLDILHEDVERLKRGDKPVEWCDKPLDSAVRAEEQHSDSESEHEEEPTGVEGREQVRRESQERLLEEAYGDRPVEGKTDVRGQEGGQQGDNEEQSGLGNMLSGFVFGDDAEKK